MWPHGDIIKVAQQCEVGDVSALMSEWPTTRELSANTSPLHMSYPGDQTPEGQHLSGLHRSQRQRGVSRLSGSFSFRQPRRDDCVREQSA